METDVEEPADEGAGGAAGDAEVPDAPNTKRRFLPSSIGITVLLPPQVTEIEAHVSWGDYRTEPPLPEDVLAAEEPEQTGEDGKRKKKERPMVDWVRAPQQRTVRLAVREGRGDAVVIPESAASQHRGGGLTLETHARLFTYETPEGNEQARALTVFLVNRRSVPHRFYADVSYAFQARIELVCPQGFRPRRDISAYRSDDFDLRVADLHYRDVCEYAVGRNSAAAWSADEDAAGRVTRVWTDPLPEAEVERVAANEDEDLKSRVVFGMEQLAEHTGAGGTALAKALRDLPVLYAEWIAAERKKVDDLAARRRETAQRLIAEMENASKRIEEGIDILSQNDIARTAFRFMNLAVASGRASPQCRNKQRCGGATGAGMATVPAGFHPAQHRRPLGSPSSGPGDCGPSVLSDGRRQDRSLSGPGSLCDCVAAD